MVNGEDIIKINLEDQSKNQFLNLINGSKHLIEDI